MSTNCNISLNLVNKTFTSPNIQGCGDIAVDLSQFEITPLSEVTNVDEFNKIIFNEFIDVKTRQTITAYPVLRLLYERYLSNNSCAIQSNGYNYQTMENISALIGDYWIDLVEQFVPSTSIWGSTLVYRNTVFDSQKYAYKSNSLFVCQDPTSQFPFSAISSDCGVEVVKVNLTSDSLVTTGATPFDSSNFFTCETYDYCDCVWTMTNYCYSEFVGSVIDDTEFEQYCEDTLYIEPVQLRITLMDAPNCGVPYQTWDPINRIFTQRLKITNTSLVPITTQYAYTATPYGTNTYGITMTATSIDVSTIEIAWSIPSGAPDPIQQTSCPGYYRNNTISNTYPPTTQQLWNATPLVSITDVDFNCEIAKLFIFVYSYSRT